MHENQEQVEFAPQYQVKKVIWRNIVSQILEKPRILKLALFNFSPKNRNLDRLTI